MSSAPAPPLPPAPPSPSAASSTLEAPSFRFASIYREPSWSAASSAAGDALAAPAVTSAASAAFASTSASASAPPLLEGVAYKGTRLGGVVVRRRLALTRGGRALVTFHDPDTPAAEQQRAGRAGTATTWHLDRGCGLRPASAAELLAAGPASRGLRPSGTWAITAALQGVESSLQLYEFSVDWPPRWATSGYTSLSLGFPDPAEAARWHEAVAGALAGMRAAHGAAGGAGAEGQAAAAAAADGAGLTAGGGAAAANGGGGGYGGGGGGDATAAGERPSGAAADTGPAAAGPGGATPYRTSPYRSATPYDSSTSGAALNETWHEARSDLGESDASASDSDGDASDEEEDGAAAGEGEGGGEEGGAAGPAPPPPPPDDEQRWIPYRQVVQTNGVAIYCHRSDDAPASGGGEFMVSCVIRGRPQRVAAALMRLRGNTTILGPAAHAEVLQPADGQGGAGGREVLRLVITATGSTGLLCAPRELVVEAIKRHDQDGVICVMFKSVQEPPAGGPGGGSGGSAAAWVSARYGSGLFRRPVRGIVAGGYTIAGLKGEGAASQESLITCIVKVDLGGACGPRSWLRPVSSLAGWTDSFLERILMSVTLVRDEVEQRRFAVQPFKLVASAKARFNQAGRLVGDSRAARAQQAGAVGAPLPSRMASVRIGGAGAVGITPAKPLAAVGLAPAAGAHPIAELGGGGDAAAVAAPPPPAESLLAPTLEVEAVPPAGGATAAAAFDLPYIQSLSLLPRRYWSEIHVAGADAPFRVIPGTPLLGIVAVFVCDKHPSILGPPPARPMDEQHDWQPFDFVLHKWAGVDGWVGFVYGDDATRNSMLKLVPHIASGSWMIKQSVGTTPVILGKALKTTYHATPTYIESGKDVDAEMDMEATAGKRLKVSHDTQPSIAELAHIERDAAAKTSSGPAPGAALEGVMKELAAVRMELRELHQKMGQMGAELRVASDNNRLRLLNERVEGLQQPIHMLKKPKTDEHGALGSLPAAGLFPANRHQLQQVTHEKITALSTFYGESFGDGVEDLAVRKTLLAAFLGARA
ncbi:hypothetical protein GPECTOR_9g721 [Gonium pectorale]|uniref:Protein ENHANCED DISEASE RESISTANCE 2 C-terminal domain-containing protein n=1 Tax=Gonium pectorale TaxID=33097 RepID=A0A150GS54_GONPE|nr:hypothetical protein GPECTOR_9g721 [Gonium pectorale]|eukprot:KXZ52675.1 hypothetical protein GPECTOR_9g721 [Gonium pectorale]